MPGIWVTSARYGLQRPLGGRTRVLGLVRATLCGAYGANHAGLGRVSGEAGYDADDGGGDQLGLSPNLCSAATA